MVRGKDPFWKYAKDLKNGRFSCNYCERDFAGGISRIKSHLSGLKGRDIQICPRVPEEVKLEVQQAIEAIDTPSKRAKSVAASNTVLQGENISGSSSSHMPNLCKGQEKSILDMQLARFLRTESTSVDAIESPFFKDFVNGVAKHGPDYQVPRCNLAFLRDLIDDFEKKVHAYVDNAKTYLVKRGCTLMFNMHPLNLSWNIFVHVYTPIGVLCIPPVIPFVNTSLGIGKAMSFVIKFIGPTNIVQVINNDYAYYNKEVKSVCKDYPWIYQTPCATRSIELLLQKIFSVPFVYNTIQVARGIGIYIYNNKVNVSYLKKKVNGSFRRLQRDEDCIASGFFMLTSLLEVENELQALQVSITTVSSNWGKPLTEKQLEKFLRSAKFTEYVIRCKEFWSRAKIVAQVMRPIFQALCLVRFEGPTSGYLYEMMECVKDALEQCRDSHDGLYDVIWTILVEVQSKIIHPIHVAAAFLNPMYMCSEKFKEDVEMTRGLKYIQNRLVAVKENEDFANQVQLYRMKDSNVFTAEAMIKLKTFHPRIWWEHYGNHIPVLKKYAIRILSQPCSSSLCEQFKSGHSDPSQHAFKLNAILMERYESLKTQIIEPIILDKLEVSDEVNYQLLFTNGSDDELDDEDKDNLDPLFILNTLGNNQYLVDWSHRYADDIIKDPTGSWLDWWPKKGMDPTGSLLDWWLENGIESSE